jgi:hypothetical protein
MIPQPPFRFESYFFIQPDCGFIPGQNVEIDTAQAKVIECVPEGCA